MPGLVEGKVVSVTEAGNLVTDITDEQLQHAPRDERVAVVCDEHETLGIYPADHEQPESTFLAIIGSGGCLELEIVGLDASMMLGVRIGEKVAVRW